MLKIVLVVNLICNCKFLIFGNWNFNFVVEVGDVVFIVKILVEVFCDVIYE